jgi:TPR repeat protein
MCATPYHRLPGDHAARRILAMAMMLVIAHGTIAPAAEILGEIAEVRGREVLIRLAPDAELHNGDLVAVFVEIPDIGEARVGTAVVSGMRGKVVVADVKQATGRIAAGQKVRAIGASAATTPAARPASPAAASASTVPATVTAADPRDTRFPPWPTIKPNQPWIGESRWWANQRSVVLCGVLKDGPAGKAGLQADDTILTVAGKNIRTNGDLKRAIEEHQPGETLDFDIERGGEKRTVPVTLEAIPPDGGNGRILAAAEAGESWAMVDIGVRYANLRGDVSYVAENDAEAISWFRRAIDAGYTSGPLFLAQMYQTGKGVEQDYTQAAILFEQARKGTGEGVRKGLVSAATNALAVLYANGWGVKKDPAREALLYTEAAKDGSLVAIHKLGGMCETGQFVEQSSHDALELYMIAAKEEYAPAEYSIGMMAYEGRGVQLDYSVARTWFDLAARHGNADAMCALGDMYEQGRGVPVDRTEAVRWYQKAATQGHAAAIKNLQRLGIRSEKEG